jgi:hypothetical protein
MKLTKKEIEIIKTIIEIDLKMIAFVKGFKKDKSSHEINLEKILIKLRGDI